MATREKWKAWNSTLPTPQIDSYTLERADDGTITSYDWPNGAGDPTTSAELTDHRRASSSFYEAGGGSSFRGWDRNLSAVPSLTFHNLNNCTEAQALACFSVTADGHLAIDMQDGINAGAAADFDFRFRLSDLPFLAPPVRYIYRLQAQNLGKNNLQLVIRGQMLDGAGNFYTPPYVGSTPDVAQQHYVQAYLECDSDMTRLDFGDFTNVTIGTSPLARCIHLGGIPKRKMRDEEYLGMMQGIDVNDWDSAYSGSSNVGATNVSSYLMNPVPDDVHVDYTFWVRRANGDTSANPRYELATIQFTGSEWTP